LAPFKINFKIKTESKSKTEIQIQNRNQKSEIKNRNQKLKKGQNENFDQPPKRIQDTILNQLKNNNKNSYKDSAAL
jgi:hypothetical protein